MIMDEIMQSVCILAHDQYGNYVIQVLLLVNFLLIFLLDFMLENSLVLASLLFYIPIWQSLF